MGSDFLEWVSGISTEAKTEGYSLTPGTVTDNFNLLSEGRVQVHVSSSPDLDPWARVASVGGGGGRGFMWIPQIGDEVLVAFNANDSREAYVIGGLWSTMNRPPAVIPTDFLTKRIIQTGMAGSPLGHTIELDDASQSVKITTSTSNQITLDPTKIAIETSGGLLKVTLNTLAVPPRVEIESTGDISLSAPAGTVSINALNVEISADLGVDVSAEGELNISGIMVNIN
jgi:phage baseplate assembly protein gpV